MTTVIDDRNAPTLPNGQRDDSLRSPKFAPRRRRWPGLLAAGALGAGVAAIAISSIYDQRSLGTKFDAGVSAAQSHVETQVDALRNAANSAAEGTAAATNRVAEAIDDAGITAAVKTALAADPKLSALRIDVSTHEGVVRLDGPAPDTKARSRAEVLAAAPQGVVKVENNLVVPGTATHLN